MQTYTTARTVFGVLSIAAWAAVIAGAIWSIASLGIGGANGRGGMLLGVTAAVPGLMVVFYGLVALVLVQTGRAGVDTAKSTHEMLEIAKKQLRMAEATERERGRAAKLSGGKTPDDAPKYGLNTAHWKAKGAGGALDVATTLAEPEPAASKPGPDQTIPASHKGATIEVMRDEALVDGRRFRDLDPAKRRGEAEDALDPSEPALRRLFAKPTSPGLD